MLARMADSVLADDLPSGLPAYAGYVDGAYVSFPAICKRFYPHAHCISITTGYGNARIIDVEAGDATINGAAAWLVDRVPVELGGFWTPEMERTRGISLQWRPGPYVRADMVSDFLTAARRLAPSLQRSSFVIWGARWTGSIPDALPAGLDALQAVNDVVGNYDLSILGPRFLR